MPALGNVKVKVGGLDDGWLAFHRPLAEQLAPLVEVWPAPKVAQVHVTWSPALIVTTEGENVKEPFGATVTLAVAAKPAAAERCKNTTAKKVQNIVFMMCELGFWHPINMPDFERDWLRLAVESWSHAARCQE